MKISKKILSIIIIMAMFIIIIATGNIKSKNTILEINNMTTEEKVAQMYMPDGIKY